MSLFWYFLIMSRRKIDWDAIKTEYVTGDISIQGLMKKYKISKGELSKHSKEEKWVDARKKYRMRAVTKAVTKSCNKRAKELEGLTDIAYNLKSTLLKASKDPDQFNRHLVQVAHGKDIDTEERVYDKLDMRAVKDMMQSVKYLEGIIRSLENIPTEAEMQRLQLEREKFEMEKEKWEREKAEQSSAHEVRVVFDTDELEGWTE